MIPIEVYEVARILALRAGAFDENHGPTSQNIADAWDIVDRLNGRGYDIVKHGEFD